jgi:uncharacterized membrane protein
LAVNSIGVRYFAGSIFFVGALVAGLISFLYRLSLPESVPMHWGFNGQPDRYGSKWEALLFVPVFMVFLGAVFGLIGMISGKRLGQYASRGINVIAGFIVVMLLVIHQTILAGNYSSVPKTVTVFLSILLVVLGFAMNGVEPNPFIGIRVPWTMNSPMVWRKTHERASKLWIRGGIFGLISCVAGLPIAIPILIFVGCVIYPVFDSYKISQAA